MNKYDQEETKGGPDYDLIDTQAQTIDDQDAGGVDSLDNMI